MFSFESKGSFDNTEAFLKKAASNDLFGRLSSYGDAGVRALSSATPKDSGETADSWYYKIEQSGSSWTIYFGNTHREDDRLIAVLLQYGHGTRNGGFVEGRDYINPAIRPIFDQIANDGWKAVTSA